MNYNWMLTLELNRMVDTYGGYYKFNILRNILLNIEEEKKEIVYILINTLNTLYKELYKLFEIDNEKYERAIVDDILEKYINFLQKYSFFIGDIISMFKDEYIKEFQLQILSHWSDMPKLENNAIGQGFLKIFDDMHENCICKHENIFVKELGELKNLYRAQRGKHYDDYKRMIPKKEHVKNKNRWNPEGVDFLYLGYSEKIEYYDDTITKGEKTCFEELRLKENECVSVCNFKSLKNDDKIINLCYEDISYSEMERSSNMFIDKMAKKKFEEILKNKKYQRKFYDNKDLDKEVKEIIKKEISDDKLKGIMVNETEVSLGNLIMKSIDEAVFLPIDSKEDPELKAYIPFHYLADYLIKKGYSGILYRSTRMNKIGLKGKNLVLFNKRDATYVENSMKVYHFKDRKYKDISSFKSDK